MFQSLTYRTQKKILFFSFLTIPLILLFLFTYWPAVSMVYYSFTDWNGYSSNWNFVGFKNFIRIFTEPKYWKLFGVSIYYFGMGIIQIIVSFSLALILSYSIKFKNLFKSVIVFPNFINAVAIAMIFMPFFRYDGLLNYILQSVGLGSLKHYWLTDAAYANYSLAFINSWSGFGFNFLLFLGAIQSVPHEIIEAAKIDGANTWHQVRYIILPSIKLVMEITLILSISGAIQVFNTPYIITGGANGTATFLLQTLNSAINSSRVGEASAMALVVIVIVAAITIVQIRFFRKD